MKLVRALYDALHTVWPSKMKWPRPWYLNYNPVDSFAIWWMNYRRISASHLRCVNCMRWPASGVCSDCMAQALYERPGGGAP